MTTHARVAARSAERARAKIAGDLDRMIVDAGISLRALSRASGVPHGYLSLIVAGRAKPSIETYAKLAVPLGADLSARLYPNTGPIIRDRHQARILEHLVTVRHPRWRIATEVAVTRPARGWIDAVLREEREAQLVAVEIESDLRRIEQTVRWSKEKADSLPSWTGWPSTLDAIGRASTVSQLLIVRRTRANRTLAVEFGSQLAIAYPAHPEDALSALTGTSTWPGAALVWAKVEPGRVRLLRTR